MSVTVTGVPGSPQSLSWVHGGDQGLELCQPAGRKVVFR